MCAALVSELLGFRYQGSKARTQKPGDGFDSYQTFLHFAQALEVPLPVYITGSRPVPEEGLFFTFSTDGSLLK